MHIVLKGGIWSLVKWRHKLIRLSKHFNSTNAIYAVAYIKSQTSFDKLTIIYNSKTISYVAVM